MKLSYKDILLTIQNRIGAMGHLHELLYKQNNIPFDEIETKDIHIFNNKLKLGAKELIILEIKN